MPQSLAELGGAAPAVTAGQLWLANETGGYWFAPNLSNYLRETVQARCRFRQFTELAEDVQSAQKSGDTFHWNIYADIPDALGGQVDEDENLATGRLEASQGKCVVTEFGLAVPWTGKLDDLAEHPVREVIRKGLEKHCARKLDVQAYMQFAATDLKIGPGGADNADSTSIKISENGTATGVNNAALTADHIAEIVLTMQERDIPSYANGDYYAVGRPRAFQTVKKDLESIHQYTESGFKLIRDGEAGRYDGCRMVYQTNVPVSNDFSANGLSDEVFFFGEDGVAECCVVPEEIRTEKPRNFGRVKEIAWYYLGNFAPTRIDASDMRVLHWTSAVV